LPGTSNGGEEIASTVVIDPALDTNGDGIVDCLEITNCDVAPPDPPEPPAWDEEYTGTLDGWGFNKNDDSELRWWVHDATITGQGCPDSALFAVGSDVLVEDSVIQGGKHGIRMARVYGGTFRNLTITVNANCGSGWSLKICEAWTGTGGHYPPSRDLVIENCTLNGSVQIGPSSNAPESHGAIVTNVILRNCVITPTFANYAVSVGAHNILIEDCTFDFKNRPDGQWMRGVQADTWSGVSATDVTVRNCTMLTYGSQVPHLVYGERADIVVVE
jgi:polygalacturonase